MNGHLYYEAGKDEYDDQLLAVARKKILPTFTVLDGRKKSFYHHTGFTLFDPYIFLPNSYD